MLSHLKTALNRNVFNGESGTKIYLHILLGLRKGLKEYFKLSFKPNFWYWFQDILSTVMLPFYYMAARYFTLRFPSHPTSIQSSYSLCCDIRLRRRYWYPQRPIFILKYPNSDQIRFILAEQKKFAKGGTGENESVNRATIQKLEAYHSGRESSELEEELIGLVACRHGFSFLFWAQLGCC